MIGRGFWFLAGALMLISLQIAQEHPIGDAGFSMSAAILMAWLSGGTVVGGVIASIICRKKRSDGNCAKISEAPTLENVTVCQGLPY